MLEKKDKIVTPTLQKYLKKKLDRVAPVVHRAPNDKNGPRNSGAFLLNSKDNSIAPLVTVHTRA